MYIYNYICKYIMYICKYECIYMYVVHSISFQTFFVQAF